MLDAPRLDDRSAQHIFEEIDEDVRRRLGIDARRDDPMAEALLRVFARYCEVIVQRLNRVPDKTYRAFLSTLDLSRLPPLPAHVPLTFSLVKKLPPAAGTVIVPVYTKVAGAPAPGAAGPLVFETTREIALTDLTLERVAALDPLEDRWSDKSGLASRDGGPGEFVFLARTPVVHEFYLRQDAIFARPGMSRLSIRLDVSGGSGPALGLEWRIPAPKGDVLLIPLEDSTSGLTKTGEVVLAPPAEWPEYDLFGRPGRWLACRLRSPLAVDPGDSDASRRADRPTIRGVAVSARWQLEESPVTAAHATAGALDLTRDFYPFGDHPRFNDVFYVANDAFGHHGSSVALNVKLTNPASGRGDSPVPRVTKAGRPVVKWEYWDGRRWDALVVRDETGAFTEDGQVLFTVPPSTGMVPVNGDARFWVRARLVGGDYGLDERVEFSDSGGYRRVPSSLAPPSIRVISVSSLSSVGPVGPEMIVTHNNLVLAEVEIDRAFAPFQRAHESRPGLYLGFRLPGDGATDARWEAVLTELSRRLGKAEFDAWIKPLRLAEYTDDEVRLQVPNESVRTSVATRFLRLIEDVVKEGEPPGRRVLLKVVNALAERPIDLYWHVRVPRTGPAYLSDADGQGPRLTWQYWDGHDWAEAAVVDDTTGSLTVPGVVTIRAADDAMPWSETSLGRDLYWVRVLWSGGAFGCRPDTTRVALNTVMAAQTLTLENELLGSSTGKPGQTFRTARTPVLSELWVEVREGEETGEEAWVSWQEVESWSSSTHEDRHFVVNRETGEVAFGNNVNGRVPPRGTNNVRLRRYQTGGGMAGNQPPGTVGQLRQTIPYVDAVINLEAAVGGQDLEDWESLAQRGSRSLRHRDRAVTTEDYEDLAKLASPQVAQARCYGGEDAARDALNGTSRPGTVSVVVVPRGTEARPRPSLDLLRRVRDFLSERAAAEVSLVVLAPRYVRVCVEAEVVAREASGGGVQVRCEERLTQFLHPVTGGDAGRGWGFGDVPHESDLYAQLEAVDGVGHVRSLRFRMEEDEPGMLERRRFLISSGEHRIQLAS